MTDAKRIVVPYGKQTISDEDVKAVVGVLRSPMLTQGPTVPAFEEAVATKVRAQYGVAVNSATSALHVACLALGLGAGDRLWTSPITFVASANCGRYCGATVDFVDIEPDTGLMSVDALRKKLEKAAHDGTLPKVVIPVHLAGNSCEMAGISALADYYGFGVIEDASHAIGGLYRGNHIGSCRYSDITVFSFHPVKIITTAEGGLATTNDPILARKMRDLRSHGITKDEQRFEEEASGPWCYEQQDLGFNYRMNDMQAALGLSQLQRLESVVQERNRQLRVYEKLLENIPVSLLRIPETNLSAGHLAIIRLNNKDVQDHRKIFEGLRAAGIGVQMHYSPVHLQPYYKKLGFEKGSFANAEAYGTNAISLPLYPGLSNEEQEMIAETLSGVVAA